MRKTLLLLAVGMMALTAAPAFASVQNIKVSGDVDSTWVVRDQFDLGIQNQGLSYYQNFLMTQTRVRVDADLTDNVAATVALINERVWDEELNDVTNAGAQDDGANDVDLNLAYVELREMLYSPLTVIIGRQNFAYGNSFVIDSAGSNNTVATGGLNGVAEDLSKRTALDAIRLVLDYNPLTIDLVAAKVDANNLAGTGSHDDDVDLFGTNMNYQLGDDMQTVLEGYFWARLNRSVNVASPGAETDTVYMPGVHLSTNPIKGLSLSGEVAAQFGNINDPSGTNNGDNADRRAMAGQVIANYAIPVDQWSPVLTAAYTYTSGEKGPGAPTSPLEDDKYTAWDPMFENQSGGKIYNSMFDLTNSHIATAKFQVSPIEDVTVGAEWNGIWLDKELTDNNAAGATVLSLRQPDGTTINPTMTSNTRLGDEVDLSVTYDYTEDVKFGFMYGLFFPGDAFASVNDDKASQVLLNGNVRF